MKTFLTLLALVCQATAMAAFPIAAPQEKDVFLTSGGLKISREGYQLILDFEVGGGPVYYNRYLKKLTRPPGASGITMGIGYDLGYNSKDQIAKDWHELSPDTIKRLQSVSGLTGSAAQYRLAAVKDIEVPWDVANKVYQTSTIPRFAKKTVVAYPGVDKLHPHIQGVMLSWVFNRGEGISSTSSRDTEKRLLRRDIPGKPKALGGHIRASIRLWAGKISGLVRRRNSEANLADEGARLSN